MAKYMLRVNYTLEGIRGVTAQGGSARKTAAAQAIKSVGGKLESFYFAFGGTDVYVIADFPDNTAAASVALAVAAAGGVTCETVVLIPPDEIDAAVAQSVKYKPPGS